MTQGEGRLNPYLQTQVSTGTALPCGTIVRAQIAVF